MTQELRKLAEAATQGKWSQTPPSGIYQGRMIVTDDRAACIGETHNANATENAAFITAANPAAILELLDRLEKAEKDAERYRWLRENNSMFYKTETGADCLRVALSHFDKTTNLWVHCNDGLDSAIDAAMEASK